MASSKSTDKGMKVGTGTHSVAALEQQLQRLRRQLMDARNRNLQRAERAAGLVEQRTGKLREQLKQARDRVRVAQVEARLKANLTADRQLQRARNKVTDLKASLEDARAELAKSRQQLASDRAAIRLEQQVEQALGRISPVAARRESQARAKPVPVPNRSIATSAAKPQTTPATGKSPERAQAAPKPTPGRRATNGRAKPDATRIRSATPVSDKGGRGPGADNPHPVDGATAIPSALNPAGGEALVNRVRRQVAAELRGQSDTQPAAAVLKVTTRVDTDAASAAEPALARPEPVPTPPRPASPAVSQTRGDTRPTNPDNGRFPASPANAGPDADEERVQAKSARERTNGDKRPHKPGPGPVRSLFDLLDE